MEKNPNPDFKQFKSLSLLINRQHGEIEVDVLDNGADAGGSVFCSPEELAHELREMADWLDTKGEDNASPDVKDVKQFAQELSDAYSTNKYAGGWSASIKMLRKRGYNDRQIEAIIRSKWTRWAADASGKYGGKVTSVDLARFLDDPKNKCSLHEVEELVRETFD